MWAVDSSFLQSLDTEQLSPAQTPRSGAPRISLRSAGHTWAGRVSSDKQVPRSYSAPILPPSSSDGTIVARECTALLSCFQPASKSRRSCLQTGSKLQLWKHVPKKKKKAYLAEYFSHLMSQHRSNTSMPNKKAKTKIKIL